jgi:hypothetical protein
MTRLQLNLAFTMSIFLLFSSLNLKANPTNTQNEAGVLDTSLTTLIELGLQHSSEVVLSESETKIQKNKLALSKTNRILPQLDLSASYQQHTYDRSYNQNGNLVSNDGRNPTLGLIVTYDLKQFFGAESALNTQQEIYAKVQEKITKRSVVRQIKQNFYSLKEIGSELLVLQQQIKLFSKIENILGRQTRLGVYNNPDRQQFQVQKGLLEADVQARNRDQDVIYFSLSDLTHISVTELKERIPAIKIEPALHYANSKAITVDAVDRLEDKTIIEGLGREYNVARLEYDRFKTFALPLVFLKYLRESPTMPSGDGPQQTAEIGLSIPLNTFFIAGKEKSILQSQIDKNRLLMEKNIFEYKNSIRLGLINLLKFKEEKKNLIFIKEQSEKLLGKAFLLLSQKRIDVVGTLDIFQKHLSSSRALLQNELQIKTLDAQLEYLLGDQPL